jgi:RNA polymerase sigma-70 factor, ECF subfamily
VCATVTRPRGARLHPEAPGARTVVWGAMDDEAHALRRIANGDADALAPLYDALAPALLALARRLCNAEEDAEEVVQDVFVRLVQTAGRFDPRLGSVRAWAYTMLRNAVTSRGRRASVRPTTAELDPDGIVGASDPWPAQERRILVDDALALLDPLDRKLVREAYLEGRPHTDLAARHGLPLGTVKSRIRRALLRLRGRFEGA